MERDDIIEYSLDAHHSEEAGKKIRKKIFLVTGILTLLTIVEVFLGAKFGKSIVGSDSGTWAIIKNSFLIMTLIKAGYIVMVFMHLGDERKSLRWVILLPYALFIMYLIFILFNDANVLYQVRQFLSL